MSGYRLLLYYRRALLRTFFLSVVHSTAAQAVRRHDGIRCFLLWLWLQDLAGRQKSAVQLPMRGKILDGKAARLGREADKQALTLSSRCSRSLNLCYNSTCDASLGKSVCSALAQQMFLQVSVSRFLRR